MTSFHFTTAEDFENTRFGCYLLDIGEKIGLPLPQIKGFILKKFNKEGCWGIKATQPGRGEEPPLEIKMVSDSKDKGLNLVMQDLIGRLCGRYSLELRRHTPFSLEEETKMENLTCMMSEKEARQNPLAFISRSWKSLSPNYMKIDAPSS